MGLGLLVVTIAATALLLGRQGFDAVDTTTQLRDRQRLAVDLITRLIVQTGFEDYSPGASPYMRSGPLPVGTPDPEPDIFGWNNAYLTNSIEGSGVAVSPATFPVSNSSRPSGCGSVNDTSCKNGSDILVVRYQGVTDPANATKSDNTMLSCGGWGEKGLTTGDLNERGASMLHVKQTADGEPALQCTYFNQATGKWVTSQPLVEGVESFQVLYGTDGVTPGIVPVDGAPAQDSMAERWLRADQLTVPGNEAGTRASWRRVRAVRIGLVLRGPVGSAQQSTTATFAPLGLPFTDAANDTGSSLTVAADRRLRQAVTFTVHLRNDLALRPPPS